MERTDTHSIQPGRARGNALEVATRLKYPEKEPDFNKTINK
jgi:hypothetical protein